MFLNLHEEKSLAEAVKKALNADSSQSMIDVKSFNVQATSLNTQFSDISDSENEIKEENTVFINMNAVRQQKTKSELPFLTIMNLKNKIAKKHQQCHMNLSFMKFI